MLISARNTSPRQDFEHLCGGKAHGRYAGVQTHSRRVFCVGTAQVVGAEAARGRSPHRSARAGSSGQLLMQPPASAGVARRIHRLTGELTDTLLAGQRWASGLAEAIPASQRAPSVLLR